MQAYFEPEQAFSIIMPQPVFEIAIAYKKKTCTLLLRFNTPRRKSNWVWAHVAFGLD